MDTMPTTNLSLQEQAYFLEEEHEDLDVIGDHFNALTRGRTQKLIDAHERYHKAIGGQKYEGLEPVLPPDVMGIYILVPELNRQ